METEEEVRIRKEVLELARTLKSHIVAISKTAKEEDTLILDHLQLAILGHTDITFELLPLENGESDATKRLSLSCALVVSQKIDIMIVDFITACCDDSGKPITILNDQTKVASLTNEIVESTLEIKEVIELYKKANN
ncbi:hypothetical protein [uncultured Nostoc sp.]|uniref:hypothetical protein n=1 Tax=uncultured Nostoc sp. TaxID=340711 RepID=UPI0035C9495B